MAVLAKASGYDAHAWRLRPATAFAWSLVLALAISTQFLVQPFVWRNWPLDDIFAGWFRVFAGNLVIALCVAAALVAAGSVRTVGAPLRAAAVASALLIGAVSGETIDRLLDIETPGPLLGAVIRWLVISGALTGLYYMWLRGQLALAQAEALDSERAERDRLASATELTVLQRQIEPHFLFNTLATARGLYRRHPERGADLLAHLSRYMQSSLAGQSAGLVTLASELSLVEAYLGVCEARMGPRLRTQIDVSDDLRALSVPALSVATLAENAIEHGLEPRAGGGRLSISAHARAGGYFDIIVEDDGVGFTATGGKGIGLANTRARLRALYGPAARLSLAQLDQGGVRATLHLPAEVAA